MIWHPQSWDDYLYWQNQDRKTLKRINALLHDIERNPYDGIGQPEPLKWDFRGYWSRRIDDYNRLIYRVANDQTADIIHCRGHYE
jgi:toxin YoeB